MEPIESIMCYLGLRGSRNYNAIYAETRNRFNNMGCNVAQMIASMGSTQTVNFIIDMIRDIMRQMSQN